MTLYTPNVFLFIRKSGRSGAVAAEGGGPPGDYRAVTADGCKGAQGGLEFRGLGFRV